MRKVSQTEYDAAKRVLSAYGDYCKPYVQHNGWTVIPAEAPRFVFEGATLETDHINAHTTNVELFELDRDKPEKFGAYMPMDSRVNITTWTGESVGRVTNRREWHRNNLGAKWRHVTVRTDWGHVYAGREYDSRQFVNFRRVKG